MSYIKTGTLITPAVKQVLVEVLFILMLFGTLFLVMFL